MTNLLSQITELISHVITWIPTILNMALEQPIILFFIAFGLVGALIRWARRLVHFA